MVKQFVLPKSLWVSLDGAVNGFPGRGNEMWKHLERKGTLAAETYKEIVIVVGHREVGRHPGTRLDWRGKEYRNFILKIMEPGGLILAWR